MAIHADSSGNPAAQATHTLTGTSPTAVGDVTYNCSGSCSLDAGTTYYLVLIGTSTNLSSFYNIQRTNSSNETNTPAGAGWSLANGTKKKDGSSNWVDADTGQDYAVMFKVTAASN